MQSRNPAAGKTEDFMCLIQEVLPHRSSLGPALKSLGLAGAYCQPDRVLEPCHCAWSQQGQESGRSQTGAPSSLEEAAEALWPC